MADPRWSRSTSSADLEPLDVAEDLLLEALAETPEFGTKDLDALCARHPAHADVLRSAHAAFAAVRAWMQGPVGERAPAALLGAEGRFRVLGELGRGGMSVVYLAWDTRMRRKVALKALLPSCEDSPVAARRRARQRARLVNEAQVLAQLDHPGIVPVYDVLEGEGGEVLVAMLRVRGGDLREVYRRSWAGQPGWELPRVVGVVQRVCEAVAYAHGKGVLHRDLKPANVMVGGFGEVFVMDWGLARTSAARVAIVGPRRGAVPASGVDVDGSLSYVQTDLDEDASESGLLTHQGDVLGTPSYMAPEQARGAVDDIDERSDVYGVGAMLYELLARRAPYAETGRSSTASEILERLRASPPAPLSRLAPRAPVELVAIAERAMARERSARYATMRELSEDLRAFLEGRVVHAHHTGAWAEARKWIGRHRLVVAVLGALLTTLVVALVTFAGLLRDSERSRTRMEVAQIAALRRLNATGRDVHSHRPWPSFVDEFEEETLHRRWVCFARGEYVRQVDGALCLVSPANAAFPTQVQLDRMLSVLSGDFEVELDFDLREFDVPTVPRGERVAGLRVMRASDNRAILEIARHAELDPAPHAGGEQTYRCYSAAPGFESPRAEHCAVRDDRVGRFRVTRVGPRFAASYWDGAWQTLIVVDDDTAAVTLELSARNWFDPEPFEFRIERVVLRHSPPSDVAPRSVWADSFDAPFLSTAYVSAGDASLAAPVDGRLYLEVLGDAGWHFVASDPLRSSIVGDFHLELEFRLDTLPLPSVGESAFHVNLTTRGLDTLASLRFVATPKGRELVVWSHRGESREALDDSRGSVRFQRRGDTVTAWLRLGEGPFEEAFTRSHVAAVDGFGFLIRLEAAAGAKGLLVSVDDLRVTPL